MAKVTKFDYALDNRMIPKFDAMIKRCTDESKKQDAVVIFEGKEGTGKTTYSIALAYYVAHKTGRYFGADHVFFKIEDLIEKYQSTTGQIFVWDEPALQMLSRDKTKVVTDLTRLLMMARKNRHFLIINIAHFNKFNDYIIADRPVGMVKVYETKRKQIRALYIPQANLRKLWDDYKRRYKKNYWQYRSRLVNIHGFPDVLNPKYKFNVLSEFDNDLYEQKKDEAIQMIGEKDHTQDAQVKKKVEDIIVLHFMTKKPYKEICQTKKYSYSSFYEMKKKHISEKRMKELEEMAESLRN